MQISNSSYVGMVSTTTLLQLSQRICCYYPMVDTTIDPKLSKQEIKLKKLTTKKIRFLKKVFLQEAGK